ncbi:hypothetical protein J0895_18335, partial [Phormidium pseudopriestleyi FRX01]
RGFLNPRLLYSNPLSVVEDVGGPQHKAAQNGRGEKTDVINHLGMLYSNPLSVVEDVGGPQPTAAQNGRGEKTDVINHLGML